MKVILVYCTLSLFINVSRHQDAVGQKVSDSVKKKSDMEYNLFQVVVEDQIWYSVMCGCFQ